MTFSACRIDMPGDIDQVLEGKIVIRNSIDDTSPFSVGGRVACVGLQQTETGGSGIAVSTPGNMQVLINGN